MFGQFVDRYATDTYGPSVGVLEAINRAGQVGDLVALDINYPFDSGVSVDQVRAALERNNRDRTATIIHFAPCDSLMRFWTARI